MTFPQRLSHAAAAARPPSPSCWPSSFIRVVGILARSNMSTRRSPRHFAPLKKLPPGSTGSDAPELRGVVFDVDGTLCEPQNYMFGQMRAALKIPKGEDILEHVYRLPSPEEQERAMEKIRDIERTAMASQVAQPGLVELMQYLDSRGVRKAICTRNFNAPVAHLLRKFLPGHVFAPVVTRDFRPPKPDPAGILHIAKSWGLVSKGTATGEQIADASGLIMVGDSIDDMEAGFRAGAATVLLVNEANRHLADSPKTSLVISRLDELVCILEDGFHEQARKDVQDDTHGKAVLDS